MYGKTWLIDYYLVISPEYNFCVKNNFANYLFY